MHLTDVTIRSLKQPEHGQTTYVDDALKGFGVRVSSKGAKAFVLVHGPARTRTTLGRYPLITLAQARVKAKELLAERTLGRHAPHNTTFSAALDLFLASLEKKNKASTIYSTTRLLKAHFLPRFRNEKLEAITPNDVARRLDAMSDRPSEARHAYVALHTFMRWCERRHFLTQSPCSRIEPPRHNVTRSRVLSDEELKKVASQALLGATSFDKIVALLLLTGQRRGQIAGLRAEWINQHDKLITFPAEIMKGNREHAMPYGTMAARILDALAKEGLLFPALGTANPYNAFSKPKIVFDLACGITGWTLHDLRRTFATRLAGLGTPVHVTEKLLHHISGTISGVAAVYNRHSYIDEMRQAIERYEVHLATLCQQ